MSRFWDNWATAYRNWRAWFAAVSLAAFLIWLLVLKNQSSQQLLRTETVISTVTQVKEYAIGEAKIYRGRLELPDDNEIEMMLLSPIPQAGDKMPVVVQHYSDGKKHYYINQIEWRLYHAR